MHIRNYLAALDFVNAQRAELGLTALERLPKGQPGNPMKCAIARAIPGAVVEQSLKLGTVRKSIPQEVQGFIADFDGADGLFDSAVGASAGLRDPGDQVDGGIDDDKGCLVPS